MGLGAFSAGAWVQFLAGKLRSCKPWDAGRKLKKKKKKLKNKEVNLSQAVVI